MRIKIGLTIAIALGLALGSVEAAAQEAKPSDMREAKPSDEKKIVAANAPVALELERTEEKSESTAQVQTRNGLYTINSSFEIGYRFKGLDGSVTKFRSDLDYDRGVRLLASDFLARSNGQGAKLFDTMLVSSFGWGGDPSQYMRVQVDKTNWYRFDGNYRRVSYFNNLTNLALNQHLADNTYQLGDFDLTLLPQNPRLKLYLGYSLDRNKGTSATTYDYSRDEFPILAPVRLESNNYRIGADGKLWVFDLSFLQGFRYSKDDTTYSISSPQPGNNTTNTSVINTFHRELPTRGRIPFTRFSLHTSIKKRVDFTGRFIYTSATTRYTFLETVTGVDFSGNEVVLDKFSITGNAKRPNGVGDVGVTVLATDRLTISETFRVNNFRINGGDLLSEALFRRRDTPFGKTELPPLFLDTTTFRLIGYRQFLNTTEADYRFHPRFSAHFGYRYTNRRIRQGDLTVPPPGELEPEEVNNNTSTVFGGFRARPFSIWTVYFDFEHGETDNVFTRVANYDFNNFRVRSIVKPTKTLAINASVVTKNNDNPSVTEGVNPKPFGVVISSRIITSSVDWTPNEKFYLSSGYTHSRLSSDAAIIFFLNNVKQQGTSLYFLRDNFFFVNTRVELHPRATFFAGYRINKDIGQGDRRPSSATELISSYPLRFQSPEARLTINLFKQLDWNAGWQYFNYKEEFSTKQNYRANLAYVSLRLRFNRE